MNVQEYESLVTERNSRRTKFMQCVHDLLEIAAGTASMVECMDLAFSLENAAGEQLDTIGEMVGVKRLLDYEPSVGSREMDDDEYRTVIQLKIAKNGWDGTNYGAQAAYDVVASAGFRIVQTDNQDGTVHVDVYDALSARSLEILNATDAFLIPAGIGKTTEMHGADVTIISSLGTGYSGISQVDEVTAEEGE